MLEIGTSGTVGGEGGNILTYPATVRMAVFVTVPGLQRTMSGREDAPKTLMLRCARDTQLTHLFLDKP